MSNSREEFILKVPITSTEIAKFISSSWKFEEALSFIVNTLKNNFGIKGFVHYTFNEIIKNAFDSYAQAGLIPGNEFILKIVIKEKNEKLIVNVMDNGGGFDNQPKSVYFKRESVTFKRKPVGSFGGEHVGLKNSESDLKRSHASLFFKNRKKVGATTSVQFDKLAIKKMA